MKKNNSFTVTNPPMIFVLALCVLAIVVLIQVLYTIFSKSPHPAMYIMFTLFLFIPFFIAMLWSKLFKVTVSGCKITVRKGTGVRYSFDISEIVKVDWKIVVTRMGQNEKITVRTASKKFTIESLMVGFDRMSAFLSANVDSSRINTYKKNMN